jgi:hypothetical protein
MEIMLKTLCNSFVFNHENKGLFFPEKDVKYSDEETFDSFIFLIS